MTTESMLPLNQRITAPTQLSLPTGFEGVTWRPATSADLPAILELDRAVEAVDDPRHVTTLEALTVDFAASGFDPEHDSLLAETADGTVIAYGTSHAEPEASSVVKAHIPGSVHPDHRGRGLGTALLDWQEARAAQHLAASELSVPGWFSTGASEHATSPRGFLTSRGYGERRWWMELTRDLGAPIPELPLHADVRLEPLTDNLSEATRLAFNDSFRDHWGSQPTNQEDWEKYGSVSTLRGDLSALAVTPENEVAALVIVSVDPAQWEAAGYTYGYIDLVATRRDWRGKGLAKSLLAQVLRNLKAEGLERAALDVDSESPTGALRLYQSVGFAPEAKSVSLVREF
ncbi:ribosomal protein S18 acetylase RimI-like enzyme [Mycetocola sp. BIGb0189]|uniref:GNAT family N-acetyltransferase n=1 Tax=Mycetocola sp. BIGb0189 TaxID=2940604 RepID=UPI00216A2C3C|nr:GNAT family N-acetyltransferase [Mycetocola sp. BIGb0189]MCS4275017.1 ribosomal protein S18 acetylase RimI-like enzyme [Mycetocola sp. BIGb0189]